MQNLSRKERILRLLQKLPDDVTYDRVIYHLGVMQAVEIGLQQAERGEVIDHDELMTQLEAEDAREAKLVSASPGRPAKHKKVHRSGRSSGGSRLRKTSSPRAGKVKKVS